MVLEIRAATASKGTSRNLGVTAARSADDDHFA